MKSTENLMNQSPTYPTRPTCPMIPTHLTPNQQRGLHIIQIRVPIVPIILKMVGRENAVVHFHGGRSQLGLRLTKVDIAVIFCMTIGALIFCAIRWPFKLLWAALKPIRQQLRYLWYRSKTTWNDHSKREVAELKRRK